jgi:MraZ protein
LVFYGTHELVIDSKNRMAIPAGIRAELQHAAESPHASIHLVVTLGEGKALSLYTRQGYEQHAANLDQSELDPDELLEYERLLFSLSQLVEIDKQGRTLLPELLLQHAGLQAQSKVVLIGAKDHLEIHDRDVWNAYVRRRLDEQGGALMNPRRAMRRKPAAEHHLPHH